MIYSDDRKSGQHTAAIEFLEAQRVGADDSPGRRGLVLCAAGTGAIADVLVAAGGQLMAMISCRSGQGGDTVEDEGGDAA